MIWDGHDWGLPVFAPGGRADRQQDNTPLGPGCKKIVEKPPSFFSHVLDSRPCVSINVVRLHIGTWRFLTL